MPRHWKRFSLLVLLIILVLLPICIKDPYHVDTMIMVAFNCMLALTWRMIMRMGQLSFGHAAFIGIGAYASALLVMRWDLSFWIALPLSGVISAAVSLVIGLPTLRLKGMFFAITTWAFNEIMSSAYLIFRKPFGGATGLYGILSPADIHLPGLPPITFDSKGAYCYLAFFIALVTALVLSRVENSRIGMKLDAIRVDDSLAESVGINLMRYKSLCFAVACFFAGVAGSFYAHYISFISPYSFDLALSSNAVVFAIVGGMSSIIGPVLGASLLTVIPTFLHAAGFFKSIIFSAFLVLVVLFLPDGLLSLPQRLAGLANRSKNGDKE